MRIGQNVQGRVWYSLEDKCYVTVGCSSLLSFYIAGAFLCMIVVVINPVPEALPTIYSPEMA